MADLISSTSYVRQRIEELRENKKLARQVELALAEKQAKDADEKKRKSDARIAAKLARIAGEEPEEIVIEEEPIIKKSPKKAAAKKETEESEEE